MSAKYSDDKLDRKASKQSYKSNPVDTFVEEKYECADAKSEDSDSEYEEVIQDEEFPSVPLTDGEAAIAPSHRAHEVISGFTINWMNMRDAESGQLLWQSRNWDEEIFEHEEEAHIPAAILKCHAVSREINFSSKHEIHNFSLRQRVILQGVCIEEWKFHFGFVMPNSTNTWQQIISAAPPDKMLPAEVLSGRLTIETSFYEGDNVIGKALMRIFYV